MRAHDRYQDAEQVLNKAQLQAKIDRILETKSMALSYGIVALGASLLTAIGFLIFG